MSEPMAHPLLYTPLEPRQIRLVQVWLDDRDQKVLDERHLARTRKKSAEEAAGVGHCNTNAGNAAVPSDDAQPTIFIRACFAVENLDSLVRPYNTISYVWGSSQTPYRIWFDGNTHLAVTRSAIQVLASLLSADITGWIWIDAICIDQKNTVERGEQVQMMYDIYSRADQVIAWTGEGFAGYPLLPNFIAELAEQFSLARDKGIQLTSLSLTSIPGLEFPSAGWTALAQFFRQPFFSRVWIVQELVAAKTIHLLCGAVSIDWNELCLCVAGMSLANLAGLLADTDDTGTMFRPRGLDGLLTTQNLRAHIRHFKQIPSLSYILATVQSFGATDARDRIYAMLNVSAHANDKQLAPNYEKPVESLFFESTHVLLTKSKPLISLLYYAGVGEVRKLNSLPSWVPDWTTNPGKTSFGITAEGSRILDEKLYSACGESPMPQLMWTNEHTTSICFKGRIISNLNSCVKILPTWRYAEGDPTTLTDNKLLLLGWLLELVRLLPPDATYPTGEQFFPNALASTLVGGDAVGNSFGSFSVADCFVDFSAFYFASFDQSSSGLCTQVPPIIQQRIRTYYERHAMRTSDVDGYTQFMSAMYDRMSLYHTNIMKNRKIFCTESKHIGLGPQLIETGDLVCLIYGSDVPFLVRARGDGTYVLVGECYVHGMMNGEGMSMGKEEDIALY